VQSVPYVNQALRNYPVIGERGRYWLKRSILGSLRWLISICRIAPVDREDCRRARLDRPASYGCGSLFNLPACTLASLPALTSILQYSALFWPSFRRVSLKSISAEDVSSTQHVSHLSNAQWKRWMCEKARSSIYISVASGDFSVS